MSKRKPDNSTPGNHKSNQKNKNRGTSGTNKTHDKVHGNRGKQKNPKNKN